MLLKRVDGRHGSFFIPPKDMYIGRSLEMYGEWCESEVALFSQIVKPGATVVEVGANIGSMTVPLAKMVGAEGTVYAIEMQPYLAQILSANLILNNSVSAQVLMAAVSDTSGSIDVPKIRYDLDFNYGGISVDYLKTISEPKDTVRVPMQTLDELFSVSRLDFLKLDVEQFELAALRGGDALIKKHRPVIYLENDDPAVTGALLDWLHARDYQTYWHQSVLFNRHNFREKSENIFENTRCVNLLAVPNNAVVKNLRPAPDASSHPLLQGK